MIDTITLIFLLCSAFIKSKININYLTCSYGFQSNGIARRFIFTYINKWNNLLESDVYVTGQNKIQV